MKQKNQPGADAFESSTAVIIISGIQIGWIFNNDLMNFPWTYEQSNVLVILTYAMFYIGAVAGLFLTCFIIDRLSKKIIYVS